jgi:ornithine decarboxylase
MTVIPPTTVNDKLRRFIADQHPATPCLVLDVDRVEQNFCALRASLPEASVFYAIKANPAAPILQRLVKLGSCFDCASINEIDMALAAGATPDRISFGNTIKKQADIAAAYARGIRIYAFDSAMELQKLAAAAPGSKVFCRLLTSGEGADWPLSKKFGCDADMAYDLLLEAHTLGLVPWGLSFHVGSQQRDPKQWDSAVKSVAKLFKKLDKKGIDLDMINLGGGFPTTYQKPVPTATEYGQRIHQSLTRHFGNAIPGTVIVEPGRGLVGDAGVVLAEVVLVSRKSKADPVRWVYLDIGLYGGMQETMNESIKYPLATTRDDDAARSRVILAGPTCDSTDVMYEKTEYLLPDTLTAGDHITFHSAGAYTTTYAAQSFNGFKPLAEHYI